MGNLVECHHDIDTGFPAFGPCECHAALLAERAARLQVEARLASTEALIVELQLLIGKLERAKHGPSRERTQRLIDQLELQLEELVTSVAEDE